MICYQTFTGDNQADAIEKGAGSDKRGKFVSLLKDALLKGTRFTRTSSAFVDLKGSPR